ncbi:MAG: ribbon-helix-helix protein, CopG family [Cyanobium sp.]
MPLTVRLDHETEQCLQELVDESGQDRSSLVRQLIRERWQQRRPAPSISEQLGGHPAHFLDTLPPGSAERPQRRRLLSEHLQGRRAERQRGSG